jgi:hypothetical protein
MQQIEPLEGILRKNLTPICRAVEMLAKSVISGTNQTVSDGLEKFTLNSPQRAQILETVVCIDSYPGSEWRLHRQWFEQSAMGNLLDEGYSAVEKSALYRCLLKVLQRKEQQFEASTEQIPFQHCCRMTMSSTRWPGCLHKCVRATSSV